MSHILSNGDTLVVRLDSQLEQLSSQALRLTKQANKLAAKMEPTLDDLNAAVSNANQTVTDIRQPTVADFAELQNTLSDTRVLISGLQSLVGANSENTHYAIENVRMATDNLNELTEVLKERPWSPVRVKQPPDRSVPRRGVNQRH